MALGDHPKRTPFYGALLMIAAFLALYPASQVQHTWLSALIYVAAAIGGFAGFLMTFRDYSRPPNRP